MLNLVSSARIGKAVISKPTMPVCYESAIRALGECLQIDEAKLWDAKAEALAAWAKIYHDDEAARKAKALRLHAYRRMGQISAELTKHRPKFDVNGPVPGARALLIESGLKTHDADACIRVARARKDIFERAINSAKPPAPTNFNHKIRDQDIGDTAILIRRGLDGAPAMVKKYTPAELVAQMNRHDCRKIVELFQPLSDWLDELLQRAAKK